MKNLLPIITALVGVSLLVGQVHAATPTPASKTSSASASPKQLDEKLSDQINELKEKIASRVSELNLVEKHGIIGTIAEVNSNKITLTDMEGKTQFVDVDEITKFASPSAKKSFGLTDLSKGTKITVLGLYNKQTKRILARFIDVTVTPTYLSGTISQIDKKALTFVMVTEDQKEITIDPQNSTKISTYSKEEGIVKLGFSKLEIGQRVVIMGYPGKNNPAVIFPSRVTVFPSLTTNPKIVVDKPVQASEEANLTPLPTASKKKTVTPAR